MSSSRPSRLATVRRRFDGWSLRRRLLAGILALFAIAFLAIGAVSTLALRTVLMHQVDGQLSQADRHAGGGGGVGGGPGGGQEPPGPLIGQPPGTLNAR